MNRINPTIMNVINAVGYILMVLAVLFISIKLALFLFPFILAYLIFIITKPIAKFLEEKIKLKSNIANLIAITSFYLIVGLILSFIVYMAISQIYVVLSMLPQSIETYQVLLTNALNNIQGKIPDYVYSSMSDFSHSFLSYIGQYGLKILNSSKHLVSKFPSFIVIMVIIFLSSYLMSENQEKLIKMAKKQIPDLWIEKYMEIKEKVFDLLFKYIKAQAILISLCFFEVFIMLNIVNIFVVKVEYIVLIAVITALVDALPIVGSGSVLMPLAIFNLSINNYKLAISLVIIYLIIVIVRQITEPKLISNSIQSNPLIALIAMYVGYKLFGIVGFILGPIYMVVLNILFSKELEYGFFKFIVDDRENENENS